jgi:hypothetical protein
MFQSSITITDYAISFHVLPENARPHSVESVVFKTPRTGHQPPIYGTTLCAASAKTLSRIRLKVTANRVHLFLLFLHVKANDLFSTPTDPTQTLKFGESTLGLFH